MAYHEHNEEKRVPELVARLAAGESVALVSDAGTPLISDPGWRLIQETRAQGIEIVSIPGPSAIIAALSIAGIATDRFVFEGFLPRRSGARGERLDHLSLERRTMVFYESVHRLPETMAALVEQFGAEREAALCRELTKLHEKGYLGTLGELFERLSDSIPLLGEFVLIVRGHDSSTTFADAQTLKIYRLLSKELSAKTALALTVEITGLPRNTVDYFSRVAN